MPDKRAGSETPMVGAFVDPVRIAGQPSDHSIRRRTTPPDINGVSSAFCMTADCPVIHVRTRRTVLMAAGNHSARQGLPDRQLNQTSVVPLGLKRKSLPREEVRQAFRKEPNSSWEEECCCSRRRPWEEDKGARIIEALREEVHHFDDNQDSRSHRTLNGLCCSAAMRKVHGINLEGEISSLAPLVGPDTETPASSAGVLSFSMSWR